MSPEDLFGRALELSAPWRVTAVRFEGGRLDLAVDFVEGSRFACPECGDEGCRVHDTRQRTWRHLDFFKYQTHLTARVPRVQCPRCGIRQVVVSWSRAGSGFTTDFEVQLLDQAREMTVSAAATASRIHPDSLWRVLRHYVAIAVAEDDLSSVRAVGLDECSKQKGHDYVTTFCDLDRSRVVFVTEGKHAGTVTEFAQTLSTHNGSADQIEEVCCDMAPAYIVGIGTALPKASLTFDRYHVMALVNAAVDQVRREESRETDGLKATRYLWLKNPENLNRGQRRSLAALRQLDLKTARAYHLKLALRRFWEFKYVRVAARYLRRWVWWATHSRLEPMARAARAIRNNWSGVLRFIESRITNGIVEGLNSKIKTALKRAYGFKTFENYRTIIHLVAGKLPLPTRS